MERRTSITTDASGRRVVAKVATTAEEAARLENEAALLEAGRHPGVVELVGIEGHGVGSVLLTAHVEGATLAAAGRLPLEEATGLIAALASTLGDLHDLGLVHGAVAPEHVVIGPTGGPVLCSLGYGGRIGEPTRSAPGVPPEFTDPARPDAGHLEPAVDVFALGALARTLVPAPPSGHALDAVARRATSPQPSARPTARAVAESLHEQVPTARLPRGLSPGPPAAARPAPTLADPLQAWRERGGSGPARLPGMGRMTGSGLRRGPGTKVLAGIGGAAAIGVALLVLAHRPAPGPSLTTASGQTASDVAPPPPDEATSGPPTTRAGSASSSTSVAAPTTTSPAPVAGRRDCPPVTALLQADVNGDGCPDAIRYADGILEAGGRKWSLGQVGDQVATGNWGCQGTRTLALFRPATGELFRFDDWAAAGRDVVATAVARVDGGSILRAADLDGDGCHEAVIERGAGLPVEVVRLPRAQP
ncbi:MAG: hypothetical protein M3066_10370 [Actinomycetota bacterium]|nr:hypothetical protein [Actinomycetota bacterium]